MTTWFAACAAACLLAGWVASKPDRSILIDLKVSDDLAKQSSLASDQGLSQNAQVLMVASIQAQLSAAEKLVERQRYRNALYASGVISGALSFYNALRLSVLYLRQRPISPRTPRNVCETGIRQQ